MGVSCGHTKTGSEQGKRAFRLVMGNRLRRRHPFLRGPPLARLEGQIAIPSLFTRFPNLRLETEEVTWREHGPGDITLRGLWLSRSSSEASGGALDASGEWRETPYRGLDEGPCSRIVTIWKVLPARPEDPTGGRLSETLSTPAAAGPERQPPGGPAPGHARCRDGQLRAPGARGRALCA